MSIPVLLVYASIISGKMRKNLVTLAAFRKGNFAIPPESLEF